MNLMTPLIQVYGMETNENPFEDIIRMNKNSELMTERGKLIKKISKNLT